MKSFEVKSGQIIVTDPCYEPTSRPDLTTVVKAKNGKWHAKCAFEGDTVITFAAWHESSKPARAGSAATEHCMAVDSGQAGVFDFAFYSEFGGKGEHDDMTSFYGIACEISSENPGFMTHGAICESGCGDGVYNVDVLIEGGECVALLIHFDVWADE